jgi:NADH:ubiquinone oxidoreductase subunit 6 (subunit J)
MPTEGTISIAFFALAAVTLASAICAMSLRNLVHCGLCLALTFAGLAAIYLQLSAEFVGFAQILVYVGAVAILIVFTILLTKNAEVHISPVSRSWAVGLIVALVSCASLVVPIIKSPSLNRAPIMKPETTVLLIGQKLMTQYVIPLEAIALVLTAALLGAVVIAMRDENPNAANITPSPVRDRTSEPKAQRESPLSPLPSFSTEDRREPAVATTAGNTSTEGNVNS